MLSSCACSHGSILRVIWLAENTSGSGEQEQLQVKSKYCHGWLH